MSVVDDLLSSPRALVALASIAYGPNFDLNRVGSPIPESSAAETAPGSHLSASHLLQDEAALTTRVCTSIDNWCWRADRERIERGLAPSAAFFRPLAERLVASPGARWWFERFDPGRQIWVAKSVDAAPDPAVFAPSLEPHGHATRARAAFATSPALSFIPCAWLFYAWEGIVRPPFGIWRMPARRSARVFEIHGPHDWMDLCRRYPTESSQIHRHMLLRELGVEARPFITPDWNAVARDFDGVFLSMIGRLTTEGVPLRSAEGLCMLEGWDSTATEWFAWVFDEPESLGPHPADGWERSRD